MNKLAVILAIAMLAATSASAVNCTQGGTLTAYFDRGIYYKEPEATGTAISGSAWITGYESVTQDCIWSRDYVITYIDGNLSAFNRFNEPGVQIKPTPSDYVNASYNLMLNVWPIGCVGDFGACSINPPITSIIGGTNGTITITGTNTYNPGSGYQPLNILNTYVYALRIDGFLTSADGSLLVAGTPRAYALSTLTNFSTTTTTSTTIITTTSTTIPLPVGQGNKTICLQFVDENSHMAVSTTSYNFTESAYGHTYEGSGTGFCIEVPSEFSGTCQFNGIRAAGYEDVDYASIIIYQGPGYLFPVALTPSQAQQFDGNASISGWVSDGITNRSGITVTAEDTTKNQPGYGVKTSVKSTASGYNISGLIEGHSYTIYTDSPSVCVKQPQYGVVATDPYRPLPCVSPSQSPTQNATLGNIIVDVSDCDSGLALRSAQVTIKCGTYPQKGPITSTSSGQARFENVRENCPYDVSVVKSGYDPSIGQKTGYSGDNVGVCLVKTGDGIPGTRPQIIVETKIKNSSGTYAYSSSITVGIFKDGSRYTNSQTTSGGYSTFSPSESGDYELRAESGCDGGTWENDAVTLQGEGGSNKYAILTCVMPGGGGSGGSQESGRLGTFLKTENMLTMFELIMMLLAAVVLFSLLGRLFNA